MIKLNRWQWGRQLQWGIVLFVIFIFLNLFFFDTTDYFKSVSNLVFSLITLIVFMISTGSTKFTEKRFKLTKQLLIWISICLAVTVSEMLIYNIPDNIYTVFTHSQFWTNTFFALSAAIFEESLCRGLFFSAFIGLGTYRSSKFNITKSAIYSSLLFGALHSINLFSGPATIVLQQIFSAIAIGTLLVTIRVITNGLFFPILIHFILDWGPLTSYSYDTGSSWVFTLTIFTIIFLASTKTLSLLDQQLQNFQIDKTK
ncbi:hypothetical protein AZI11_12955 (plasmid) [Levilactobacillus brevis]|uniref:CPBP family intramembrane glutamic endopeptidase n=1 Tax=Levilactobacillus brevis TaxID=1580 RepID=UPI000A20B1C4|nr:CPBP family intramembrane glutamic endopeptidase [Levilactobacillus brevis]ARN93848.1 hypothetical protein AZI11_12955 [Levilactobacillus brevis]ARN96484.1 hypothetical protein AZI12_13380 [Levilactobacillus brevis]